MKTETLKDYEGYEGIDADLATSLFEYGLIWKKGIEGHENDYHFIYGVGYDKNKNYNKFDWSDIAIDTDPKKEWNFVEWESVCAFTGLSEEDFLDQELPQIVFDLIQYYGYENILGSSYDPFEIKEGE